MSKLCKNAHPSAKKEGFFKKIFRRIFTDKRKALKTTVADGGRCNCSKVQSPTNKATYVQRPETQRNGACRLQPPAKSRYRESVVYNYANPPYAAPYAYDLEFDSYLPSSSFDVPTPNVTPPPQQNSSPSLYSLENSDPLEKYIDPETVSARKQFYRKSRIVYDPQALNMNKTGKRQLAITPFTTNAFRKSAISAGPMRQSLYFPTPAPSKASSPLFFATEQPQLEDRADSRNLRYRRQSCTGSSQHFDIANAEHPKVPPPERYQSIQGAYKYRRRCKTSASATSNVSDSLKQPLLEFQPNELQQMAQRHNIDVTVNDNKPEPAF